MSRDSQSVSRDERSLWMTGYRLIWGADLSAKLKHALHLVFFRCGVRSKCFAAVGTLAKLAGADASTVRRHLHELVENGLLNAKPVDGQTTCYTIRWSQLKQLQRSDADVDGKQEPSADLNENPFTECDPSPDRLPDPDSQVAGPPLANCQSNKLLNHNLEQTPSTGRGWAEINKELRDAEVKWPDNAVKSAREKHCSLQDIQAVIDFGYSHRDAWDDFGLALYHRVANATPDQRPDDSATWLPMKLAVVRQAKTAQHTAIAKRLSEMTHAEIRSVLEWGIESGWLRTRKTLDQFNEDADDFLKFPANQSTLSKLFSARDGAASNRAPNAQPPPTVSSAQPTKTDTPRQ